MNSSDPTAISPEKSTLHNSGSTSAQDNDRSSSRRRLIESEIYEQATRLFAEKGFAGTSLQDIADAMGMTRPALYYYVKNKDELLAQLVTEITQGPAESAASIAYSEELTPTEKLRALVFDTASRQAHHGARFRLVIRSEAELPPKLADAHMTAKRQVLEGYCHVVDEGIRSGEFRPGTTRTVALAAIGMSNWVAWWFRPDSQQSVEEVAEEIASLAVSMLAQPLERMPEERDRNSPAAAISLLRQDIDYLERVLDNETPNRLDKFSKT